MTEQHAAAVAHVPILIMGMHRSGTSAVARVIEALGAYPGEPEELLPAHKNDNPAGYWERTDIVREHDRLLASVGHAWDRVAGFDASALDNEQFKSLHDALRPIIDSLQAHGTTWLVKDPRLSILLPLWLPLVDRAACVVVVRDPREIAASLRDTPRGILTSQFPLLLWEKYLRSLLRGLQGRHALFVSYTALLADPQTQTSRLLHGLDALGAAGLSLPTSSPADLIDDDQHHSRIEEHLTLSPEQAALADWLEAQTREAGPVTVTGYPDAVPPDATLAEFEAAFDHHIERGSAEANHRIEVIQHLHAEREQGYRRQAQEYEQEIAVHQHDLALERTRVSELTSELAAASDATNTLRQQHAELSRHAAALGSSVDELKTSLSWRITAPLRWIARALTPRFSWNVEQKLFRLYYGFPGVSHSRKRAFVLWLHKRASWLTRKTMSYHLQQRSETTNRSLGRPESAHRRPRMDRAWASVAIQRMPRHPLISIAMPVYNIDPRWLMLAVDSVREQYYPHWELCIADDASTNPQTRAALDQLVEEDNAQIKVMRLPKNVGIAIASNAALGLATGEYIGLLDHDDELTRDALLEVARTIINANPDFVYSDEDKLDFDGSHCEPHFKPDFSPDFFFASNYLCHFSVIRRSLVEDIRGFRSGFDGAQDYDLFLRAIERSEKIVHIPKVLYHWRKTATSTASKSSAKPKSWSAGQRALVDSMQRQRIAADVELGPYPNTYRVRRRIHGTPLVSIVIPFRDKPDVLSVCIRSILDKTDYPHFEIVGIDNDSSDLAMHALKDKLVRADARVRFVHYARPFNYSAINNFGVTQTRGEHLLLLNNDTEVIAPEWLRAMLEHSQRPDVGIVGAKLLYPDKRIQHTGVVIGAGGVAGHAHLLMDGQYPGYFGRAQLPQNVSAVTFACAMTRRAVFDQLGGLNEKELAIAFNDVDFCLRAREAGYLIVYTPFAELYHHESLTRGSEDNAEKKARFAFEVDYMQKRHAEILRDGDPYYNRNLRLDISDFSPKPGYADQLPL